MITSEFVVKPKKIKTLMPKKKRASQDKALTPAKRSNAPKQHFLAGKFIIHHPNAGINPLVDAAAYLFSVAGKLRQLKQYRNLSNLQKELIDEIDHFQDLAKARGYSADFIMVGRLAVSATLDEIIAYSSWGQDGQWDPHNLQNYYNKEATQGDRFFIILERIIKDPGIYIDLMELLYICLSFGYQGQYRHADAGTVQLEQISHSLYLRIRSHHGDLNKTLSPQNTKPVIPDKKRKASFYWFLLALVSTATIAIFFSFNYLLDHISDQSFHKLAAVKENNAL